jgi:hypothetical protein
MRRTEDFAGLGLIFYGDLSALPHMKLRGAPERRPSLPIHGLEAIADVVAAASAAASPWHDGFHLIDLSAKALTHLSQFISPPIAGLSSLMHADLPPGARQATALLASHIPGIGCVGLLNVAGRVAIYRNGVLQEPKIK